MEQSSSWELAASFFLWNSPVFYVTRILITVATGAKYWSVFWAKRIKSALSHSAVLQLLLRFEALFVKLRKAPLKLPRVCPNAVCASAGNYSAPTGRIFTMFDIWIFFENPSRKFKFVENLTRITDILREDQYTFMVMSHSILFRMRNVSDKKKSCRENKNKHCVLNKVFFLNRAVYEVM